MDDIDRAQENIEREMEITLRARAYYQRVEVSTGYCEDCGEQIPQARIDAINATTCIECAKLEEQRFKKWGV